MIYLMTTDTKTTPTEFIDWLNVELEKRNYADSEASRLAGLSHGAIYEIRSGNRPGLKKCQALADLFGVSVDYVLQLAGHIPEKPTSDDFDPEVREVLDLILAMLQDIRKSPGGRIALRRLVNVIYTQASAYEAAMRAARGEFTEPVD